jgi:hypothetical protein
MPKVVFLGRVLPTVANVTINNPHEITWIEPGIGLNVQFRAVIKNSAIEVSCDLNRYTRDDFVHIYIRALDIARASIDLVAFANGIGYTTILEKFVDDTGEASDILIGDPRLPALCTAFDLTSERFDAVYNLVLTSPPIFWALNDLIVANTLPHVGVVNCARAIESLKYLIAKPGVSRSRAWEQFRIALRVSESYLRLILENSIENRHGNRVYISG